MSTMSEIHAEVSEQTGCATIACGGIPSVALVWRDEWCGGVEAICAECAEHYSHRPWVMARAVLLPYA